MLSEKQDSKMGLNPLANGSQVRTAKWRKDGAIRQAKFKDEQRKLGKRRAEYWVTDSEKRALDALLAKMRA